MTEQLNPAIESMIDWQVTLRQDLVLRRHLFRKQPYYIVHDPITFQNHRLSLQDYRIVTSLRTDRTLQECFRQLVVDGDLNEDERQAFFEFVEKLHRLGLLSLPLTNAEVLYRKFQATQQAQQKKSVSKILFFRCALANPDEFLTRTLPLFGWLFHPLMLVIWLIAGAAGASILCVRYDDFSRPLNSLLSGTNLGLLALTFLGLKVWHELGHGYACKRFGGRVPEMGTILIAGMPLAYMDASAAWSFPKRRQRLIVMLAGMYFESLIAIPAIFVWATSSETTLGLFAYQLVFMAGFTTLLFNANPLMRYDGYFIFSELIGIPNLRQRSVQEIRACLKRVFLGLPRTTLSTSRRMRAFFLLFGTCAVIYRTSVILTIAFVLAGKLLVAGVALGVYFVGSTLASLAVRVSRYLLWSEETAPVRTRARCCCGMLLLGIPSLLCFLPVFGSVTVFGIVSAQQESKVRVATPGIVTRVFARPGQRVERGTQLVQLQNVQTRGALQVAKADLQLAILEKQDNAADSIGRATQLEYLVAQKKHELLHAQRACQRLTVATSSRGRVADCVQQNSSGSYLFEGDVVATIVEGKTLLRSWLTAEQMRITGPSPGDVVVCRFADHAQRQFRGRITDVAVAAVDQIDNNAITSRAGGSILVDPANNKTLEPMFQLTIEVPDRIQNTLIHNSQSSIKLARRYEPIGLWISRKCMRFLNKLRVG